jgi:hypothetical protein
VGLVHRQDSLSLVRNSSSNSRRLSRSPSPNRHGFVARDKPVLELSHGHFEDRWDSLSTKSSLSAIAGAEIRPISGGGLLCNTTRIRKKEGNSINSNPLQLGRKSEISQISSDRKMCAPIQSLDPLLGVEGGGIPRILVHLNSDSKQYVGDVVGEGMELAGGGRNFVPNQ